MKQCNLETTKEWQKQYKLEHGESYQNQWRKKHLKETAKNFNNWYHENHDTARKTNNCRYKNKPLHKTQHINKNKKTISGKDVSMYNTEVHKLPTKKCKRCLELARVERLPEMIIVSPEYVK